MTATETDVLHEPDRWCGLSLAEHRRLLAGALLEALREEPGVTGAEVRVGPVEWPYDLMAVVETDVGALRSPLWSDARATIFCDRSVHPANRRQLAPGLALRETIDRLRRRLAVPYSLEARGLTVTMSPEDGVERVWSAERSIFGGKTSVTREDRIARAAETDLRDLLAHFYSGPSLRLVGEDGTAFLLPGAADDADARLVTLCHGCGRWAEDAEPECAACGGVVEIVAAARPTRR